MIEGLLTQPFVALRCFFDPLSLSSKTNPIPLKKWITSTSFTYCQLLESYCGGS